MNTYDIERVVRLVVIQELNVLAAALGGPAAANAYAIASLRAEQEREKARLEAARHGC